MAFCKNCGAQIAEGKKFCAACGEPLPEQKQEAVVGAYNGPPTQYGHERQQQYRQQQNQQSLWQDSAQNASRQAGGIDPMDIQENKTMGGLAYILFFLPLIACPNSRYARFHANQSLVLWLSTFACYIATFLLTTLFLFTLPVLSIVTTILMAALSICVFVFWVIGLINGFSGKARQLPLIGKFRLIK